MVLSAAAQELETKHLGFTISPHEECGVEEAVRIVEAQGGEVVVLTLGPAEAVEQLRECLALGADRAIHLVTTEEWDGQATAAAIAEAIRVEAPFELVLFGNESADAGGYQVGIRVAEALGLPIVNGIKGMTVGDGNVRCEQEAGGGRDVFEVPLPAVVTVLEGLNLPRYPSVPAKLRAKSKPVAASTPTRPPSRLQKVRLTVPEGQAQRAEILGEGPAAAPRVVELLQELGLLV